MIDLDSLNEAQRAAVLTTQGPLLVLAGAGSGKTRVLTYRIAHLVEDLGVAPWSILAVTFTNKAASEMRERLNALLAGSTRGMWICTFHSMCVRMLRRYAERVGFSENFTIYDADDSKRLVKQCLSDLGYGGSKSISDGAVRARISELKNDLVSPEDFTPRLGPPLDKTVKGVYREYQRRLRRANALDFDDLLFYAHELLEANTDVRDEYGSRFRYILVDEYQDTNRAQYQITQLLAKVHGNLMVVGDDDQSIYSWRGADIRNILDFERDWPETTTVKLEQNYRSTGVILDAANAVISHNSDRKDKHLFTEGERGEKISVFLAADERDEGRWIASEIEKLHDAGTSYSDIAVFYRTNAQSRTLEDMFLRAGVSYRIVGGTRFFDRTEIRDISAYLKLAVNHDDDVSCRRVINVPRRGIGKTTVERIAQSAAQRDISLFEAAREESLDPSCRASTRSALAEFTDLVDEASRYSGRLDNVVDMIIERTGIIDFYRAQNSEEALGRIENINEFQGVVHDYMEGHELVPDADDMDLDFSSDSNAGAGEEGTGYHEPTLSDFMEWLSLRSDLDTLDDEQCEAVTFMTVHSAKGLEFDDVFVAGMEETIFPHANSIRSGSVEEERRLAYVAITRARKRLYLSHAERRRTYNREQANPRSRFIDEIPDELIEHEGVGSLGYSGTGWEKRGDRRGISGSGRGEEMYGGRVFGKIGHTGAGDGRSSVRAKRSSSDYNVGDHVDHKVFGRGEVVGVDEETVTVTFEKTGRTKNLLKDFAPIVKVE